MKRRWAAAAAATALFIYAAACVDVALRARSAFLEGEKWLEWNARPELKKAYFDAEFEARERALRRQRDEGLISAADFQKRTAVAAFERDRAMEESSLKYAYAWFQSAAELLTPPQTRWTRLARERMRTTRLLWKRELDAKRVPYRDYMLQ